MKSAFKVVFLLSFLLFSLSTWAQYKTFTQEDLRDLESIEEGTNLQKRDSATGIFLQDYSTTSDQSRISFLYHINSDAESAFELTTMEFIYAKKFEFAWLEVFASRTSARFSEITEMNTNIGTDFLDQRESTDSLFSFGAGIMYRSQFMKSLLDTDKVFESTSFSLAYHSFTEEFRAESYKGPGIKADFGIHRRASRGMHYGIKMSYNLAEVKKAAEFDTDTSSDRSLLLTWLSIGFDLSFYF